MLCHISRHVFKTADVVHGDLTRHRYFYIPARKEHRGIGGIFYDDLSSEEAGFDVRSFTKDVARGMLESWMPIVEANRARSFTPEQRQWQVGGLPGSQVGSTRQAVPSGC